MTAASPDASRPAIGAGLAGLRVVDCSDRSGEFCATLLAALGAEVRRAAAGEVPSCADADAVILGGTPSDLSRRGVDPAALLARHPRLVVAVISPFGREGPRAEWRSCDTVAQAVGGMVWVNGHADGPPLRGLGPQAYHCAGLHAALGVVLALHARRRGAPGQLVDVSLQESVCAALEHVSGRFDERGVVAARQGTLHWSGAFRAAACRDGLVLLSHLGDWTALLEWVKSDGAAADLVEPGWADETRRRVDAAHVFDVLAAWAARYRAADLLEQAALRRLPFAPIWPLSAVAQHPQLAARGFWPAGETGVGRRETGEAPTLGVWRSALGVGRRSGLDERLDAGDPPSCPSPARREGTLDAAADDDFDMPTPHAPISRLPSPVARPTSGNAERTTRDAQRPLQGLRILDLTWVVAGPLATRVLADHGAEVIKLERLDAPAAGRDGALFGNLNRGKKSIAIDLSDARGAALARRLAARCDVVIDNFSPRVMAQFGLDAAALPPGVLSVSLSGFGAGGPYADRVSYGPTLQAQSGFTWHMRAPGGAPAGWGFAYADMACGYAAALAVLAVLLNRDDEDPTPRPGSAGASPSQGRDPHANLASRGDDPWEGEAPAEPGRGVVWLLAESPRRSAHARHLDLAQLEITAALIGPALAAARRGAAIDDAAGNHAPEGPAAPHGIYRCRDRAGEGLAAQRWCAIAVFDDADWQRCAAVLDAEWARSPLFAGAAGRLRHAAELDRHLAAWMRARRAEAVVAALQAAGVAAGVVADAADLRHDPQLAARGYWQATPGGATLDGVIPRLSLTAGAIAAPAPRRGQHTAQVLRDLLGMEQSAVDQLRRDGVIA